jgi:hypothetical protein
MKQQDFPRVREAIVSMMNTFHMFFLCLSLFRGSRSGKRQKRGDQIKCWSIMKASPGKRQTGKKRERCEKQKEMLLLSFSDVPIFTAVSL